MQKMTYFAIYMIVDCVVPESIHTPPTESNWHFLGKGGIKSQTLKEKYEGDLEFPGG